MSRKPKEQDKPKRRTGRPKAIIPWQRVDQMLMAQCDGVMIANSLGIAPDTLYNACEREHKLTFSAYAQQKRDRGVATAKEVFYRQAWIDPNDGQQSTRQIFWLKNHAGMADKQEVKQTVNGDGVQLVVHLPDNSRTDGR